MKKIVALASLTLVLSACSSIGSDSTTTEYTSESWKTMIAETCTTFFDGCNTCRRGENSDAAACTRKFCENYEQPRCLDGEQE